MSEYEPSEPEVRMLAKELAKHWGRWGRFPDADTEMARWVLRRYEPRDSQQRCDGSGKLLHAPGGAVSRDEMKYGVTMLVQQSACPGCPRCAKPERPAGSGRGVSQKLMDAMRDSDHEAKCGHYGQGHADGLAAARNLNTPAPLSPTVEDFAQVVREDANGYHNKERAMLLVAMNVGKVLVQIRDLLLEGK